MKRIFLLISLLFSVFLTNAQNADESTALKLVSNNYEAIGLSKEQLANLKLSSTYYNDIAGTQMVYLVQAYQGLPVYNQMLVLAFKDGKLVSNAGTLLTDMDKKTDFKSPTPAIVPAGAISYAFAACKLNLPSDLRVINTLENGRKLDFGVVEGVTENVTTELMWMPVEKGKEFSVKLIYEVQVVPHGKADWWNVHIDALTGAVIDKKNLTVYESKEANHTDFLSLLNQKTSTAKHQKINFAQTVTGLFNPPPPPTVTSAAYHVIPFPAESPNFGSPATVNSPWLLSGAGNNATTNGWHFDGTTNYNITRGNNVFAYLDAGDINAPNATINWPDTSTTAIPSLTFTQTPNFSLQPTVTNNKKFALNNLFYWNNLMHDVYYQYGFTEVTGNFQTDNMARGGNGNDYVQAEAQDGGGTSNANFSTPVDGIRPRMQMYLFGPGPLTLLVNPPSTIAGGYTAIESNFSTNNKLANVGPVTAPVAYFTDGAGTHEACTGASTNPIAGKIALIMRGNCNFTVKVKAAELGGAVGVIMINNVAGGPITMGGTDNTITIPAVMVSDVDGALFAANLAAGLNVTLQGSPNLDGDIDNGIVCHEFGHGISTRLTGGPANSSCLGNAEEGGEGWSDYIALMMTTNWATAQLTDGTLARPMGTYAIGQVATGLGIRNYPYSTNTTTNPLNYSHLGLGAVAPWNFSNGTEVHNIGEVWCMALWEMTWGLIQQQGSINPNLFNATSTGGNSVALKLVVEGMKLQPCSPGFLDARNAILRADQNLYAGAHLCAIWTAFAKRGMGWNAVQGSSNSASDQTASFALPPAPTITSQPASVTVCAGSNATFTVGTQTTPFPVIDFPAYNWQVSTDGGVTWNNVSPVATTATLTLTNVTVGMNDNRYRCQLTAGCTGTNVTTAAATLSVTSSTANITTQPANTSGCVGTNATFAIAASGTNTYNWQVSTDNGATWNNVSPVNTTTTLTLTAITAVMNNYQYRCQVTGGCPSTTINSATATLTVTTGAISITTQPANTAACAGANASISITATGPSLTYNWQVSTDGGVTWNNVSPVNTTATLNLTGVTAGMNNNQYQCVLNGPGACTAAGVTSAAAVLTINNPIAITTQPTNTSACIGSNANFSVAASGTNPTYNWQVSTDNGATWNNVSPANTTAALTVSSVTAGMDGYQYRCQVAGTCTAVAVNSTTAILTVNNSLSITSQPANTAVCVGNTANFSITVAGSNPTYNWQVSTDNGATWNNVSPVNTTSALAVAGVTAAMNNNQYRCQVAISCNIVPVNSNAGILTVNNPPAVTAQPSNAAVCVGGNNSFCVTATGVNLTYQWQVNTGGCSGAAWTNIVGATSSCYDVTGATAAMNGYAYQCIVSSGACTPAATSNCATLTVNAEAAITSQPVSSSGCTGGTATFSVTATGAGLTYNWQVSTAGGATWNNLTPAVTTATLTLNNVTAAMNGNQYHCQVGGTCTTGLITSSAATLSLSTTVSFTTQPVDAGVCAGIDVSFTAAAIGTGLTYNWQVSTDNGVTWNNVSPVNNTGTLNIIAPTVAMNGNKYRLMATGDCNPSGVSSDVVTLSVNTSVTLTSDPVDVIGCLGSAAVFSVTATGSSISYQWQVSVAGGPWVDLINAAPYSGVNTNTLTVASQGSSLNGNRYRLNASGAPCGGVVTSASALLDVRALPVVVLTAAANSNITPYIRTMLYTTVSPPGNYSYQWFRDGNLVPALTADKFSVTVDDLGDYDVIVTDLATGCSSLNSNKASVDHAVSGELFIYPNPSSGSFQVRYFSSTNTTRTLNVYDSKGARVYTKAYTITDPYTKMDVNIENAASDVYLVIVTDASGKRIATGKVVIK